jgi:hypothetical protein
MYILFFISSSNTVSWNASQTVYPSSIEFFYLLGWLITLQAVLRTHTIGYTWDSMLWAIVQILVLQCGPQGRIWLYAIGNVAESGSAMWATRQDLTLCYRQLCRVWFCTMGHKAGSGSMLWVTVQILVLQCGPQGRIRLYAIDNYAESGFAIWAIRQDLTPCYGQLCRVWFCTVGHSAKQPRILFISD